METRITTFTVLRLIQALSAASRDVQGGLDAPVRLLDWEMNHENIRTLQVCSSESEVLIQFDPNESYKSPELLAMLESYRKARGEGALEPGESENES